MPQQTCQEEGSIRLSTANLESPNGDIVYCMQCQNQDSFENMAQMRLFPEYTTHAFEKNCLNSDRRFPSFSCKSSLRSRDAIDTIEGVTQSWRIATQALNT